MKNILAENMRRFGTKNLTEDDDRNNNGYPDNSENPSRPTKLTGSYTTITLDDFKKDYVGMQITNVAYLSNSGELILSTPTRNIVFGCSGGADIEVDGSELENIKKTVIKQIEIGSLYDEITVEFANGEYLVISDGTGGEGIEVYVN